MIDHILDFSETGAYLKVDQGCLIIEIEGREPTRIPCGEIAAVVLGHPQITLTRSVLSDLCAGGCAIIACADNYLPVGMMLPLTGYHAPARRFTAQASASMPVKKRLWRQVVRAKIRAQGRALKDVHGDDFGLMELAEEVKSGDPENLEGQAARAYWPALFDDVDFLRDTTAPNQNRYLNYGYAVLRAIVARAICASGLHPGLGLHHHHRNNAYCLADDLMEPFRPIVDRAVVAITAEFGGGAAMDRTLKGRLIQPLLDGYPFEGQSRSLFDIAARVTGSLGAVFEEQQKDLALPDI